MRRYLPILMLAAFCFFLTSCNIAPTAEDILAHSTENDEQNSALANLRAEDLAFLLQTLQQEQPHFEPSVYESYINEMNINLLDLDDMAFYYEVKRILAAANDAHTRVVSKVQAVETIFPVWSIKKIDGAWYVYGIGEKYGDYLKYELSAINGMPVPAIEILAKPYISHENDTNFNTQFAEEIKTAEFLWYLGVIDSLEIIPVTLIAPDGGSVDIDIETFPSDDYSAYGGTWVNAPSTSRNWERNYYFTPLDDGILYIQYALCQEDDAQTIDEFQQALLEELENSQYNTVIFDLRYNEGGVYSLFSHVIDALGQSRAQSGFDLFCLIGEQTFSTGVLHATQLLGYGAILAGTPTGGSVNFFANTELVDLPNSGIQISFSTHYEETIQGYEGHSLYPRILVPQSVEKYAAGIDCDIEAVKEFSGE